MANYIILTLCILIVLSYIFDITSQYTKVPVVVFLIAMGILLQLTIKTTGFVLPDLRPVLSVIGTLGIIMIVLEATLDIKLKRRKKDLIIKSVSSAFGLFAVSVAVLSFLFVNMLGFTLSDSILNSIPLSIISSSVAISSSYNLGMAEKEFVIYESSFSDIIGIMIFNFFLLNETSVLKSILGFIGDSALTLLIAMISTAAIAFLLYRINYHINYVIILTSIILVYSLAEIVHLPALLLIIVFGLVLSNNQLIEFDFIRRRIDFRKFSEDVDSFRKILHELTFLVRSFFFIIFGFYIKIEGLLDFGNIFNGIAITFGIFFFRWLFFSYILRMPAIPLVFFAPRGLVNILLFISIPASMRLPFLTEETFTIIILLTIFVLMAGNIIYNKSAHR
jgi:Kef-type K+ transport system membrane component KefB